MRAKVVTMMRSYVQDEVNQEVSEQNEVDGMKKKHFMSIQCSNMQRRPTAATPLAESLQHFPLASFKGVASWR